MDIKKKLRSFINSHIYLRNFAIIEVNNKKKSLNLYKNNYRNYEVKDIKFVIIKNYINQLNLKKSFYNHIFNHLYIINKDIDKKACIIKFLLEHNYNKIKKIHSAFITKEDYFLFNEFNIKVDKIKFTRLKITFVSIISVLIQGIIESRRSRKFYSKKNYKIDPTVKYSIIIRDWKKTCQDFYLKNINDSLNNVIIYLKPDILNLFKTKKKISYLRYLRKNNVDYFEYYSKINFYKILKKAIKIYFSSFPNEIKLNLIQVIIQRIWIEKFIKYLTIKFPDIQEFYTKEEYYTGTTYLTELLRKNNIKTINFAHGVGSYCPLVNYDIFYVFSKYQIKYYIENALNTEFKYYKTEYSVKKQDLSVDKKIALLFICQNFLSQKRLNRYKFRYKKIIEYLEKFAKDFNVPVYAKYKPLSTHVDRVFSKNIKIIEKVEDLPKDFNYIASTFGSTYALELLDLMPFFVFSPGGKLSYEYYFPDVDFLYIKSYQEFIDKIKKFLKTPKYYYEYWNNLIALFQEQN